MIRVELLDHMGTDKDVANAARVSFDKEDTNPLPTPRDEHLIHFLARGMTTADYEEFLRDVAAKGVQMMYHGKPEGAQDDLIALLKAWRRTPSHFTPFAHCMAKFRLYVPIFVLRQLNKHQVGMCVSGDTMITFKRLGAGLTPKVSIADLWKMWEGHGPKYQGGKKGQYNVLKRWIRVYNTETGKFDRAKISNVIKSGVKKVYRITLESGKSVKLTSDHRFYTPEGWNTLDNCEMMKIGSSEQMAFKKNLQIGTNGWQVAGNGAYRDKEWMAARLEEGLNYGEIASLSGCAKDTIRAYVARHGLKYPEINYDKKIPWNKGKTYKNGPLQHSEEGKKAIIAARSGANSNFWKGGTTSERSDVGRWTTQIAPQVHLKFNYKCQECMKPSAELHAHHVIPVYQDNTQARNFNNLVTVCGPCHRQIHKTVASELSFLKKMIEKGHNFEHFVPKKRVRMGNPLKIKWEKVMKIEYVGEEEVYDLTVDHPSHNFIGNGLILHNCSNEVSRRYVSSEPELYAPDELRAKADNVKQGSSDIEANPDVLFSWSPLPESAYTWKDDLQSVYRSVVNLYNHWIEQGVCAEQARMILPQSMMTSIIWTGSLAAWARLYTLRTDPHTQLETQNVAKLIGDEMGKLFPISWDALTN